VAVLLATCAGAGAQAVLGSNVDPGGGGDILACSANGMTGGQTTSAGAYPVGTTTCLSSYTAVRAYSMDGEAYCGGGSWIHTVAPNANYAERARFDQNHDNLCLDGTWHVSGVWPYSEWRYSEGVIMEGNYDPNEGHVYWDIQQYRKP
jgi:hypothetical protein